MEFFKHAYSDVLNKIPTKFLECYCEFIRSDMLKQQKPLLRVMGEGWAVLKYVAKFTELTRFADDYVTTYMDKVRKFEDGLKWSIRGKIVGLLLQDMDLMAKTDMAIEREVDDTRNIREAVLKISERFRLRG